MDAETVKKKFTSFFVGKGGAATATVVVASASASAVAPRFQFHFGSGARKCPRVTLVVGSDTAQRNLEVHWFQSKSNLSFSLR